MTNRISRHLNWGKKLLLSAAGFAAIAVPVTIGLLHAPLGWAQTAQSPPDANPPLAFDVASVKPAAPDQQGRSILFQPGGGVNFTNVPLHMILTFAYDVRDFQVSGEPGWMKTELFDIKAKGEVNGSSNPREMTDAQRLTLQEQNRQRTRTLLAERFGLKVHRETREAPVYALVQAKGGHKLTPNPATDGPQRLGSRGRGQMTGTRIAVPMICQFLAGQLGRPVVDQTGLSGLFDVELKWTPDPPPSVPGDSESLAASDPGGPSLAAALQEQLGLRLESKKGPVEVIVIDRVTKPTEN